MKLRVPVTVTNAACELFNEAYNNALKSLYNIKYDCVNDSKNNLSAYIWAKQSNCDQPSEIDCLIGTLYQTYTPCDRTAASYTCEITFTYETGTTVPLATCSLIDATINIL